MNARQFMPLLNFVFLIWNIKSDICIITSNKTDTVYYPIPILQRLTNRKICAIIYSVEIYEKTKKLVEKKKRKK